MLAVAVEFEAGEDALLDGRFWTILESLRAQSVLVRARRDNVVYSQVQQRTQGLQMEIPKIQRVRTIQVILHSTAGLSEKALLLPSEKQE